MASFGTPMVAQKVRSDSEQPGTLTAATRVISFDRLNRGTERIRKQILRNVTSDSSRQVDEQSISVRHIHRPRQVGAGSLWCRPRIGLRRSGHHSLLSRGRLSVTAQPTTNPCDDITHAQSNRVKMLHADGRDGSASQRREGGAPEAPFGAPHPRSRRRSSVCAICVPLSAGLRHGGNARDGHRSGPQLHPTAVSETAATSSSRRRPATSPGRGSTTAITAS